MTRHVGETLKEHANTLYKALHKVPISKLLAFKKAQGEDSLRPFRPLIYVHEDSTLATVLELLRQEEILAVPIYRTPKDTDSMEFTGIISVYDILAWTVFQKLFDQLSSTENLTFEKFLELTQAEQVFFSTQVKELIGITTESSESWTLHSSEPISSLLQMLTSASYHRVLVIDDEVVAENARAPSPTHQAASEDLPEDVDQQMAEGDDEGLQSEVPPYCSIVMVTQMDLLDYLYASFAHEVNPTLKNSFGRILHLAVMDVDEICAQRRAAVVARMDPNQPVSVQAQSAGAHVQDVSAPGKPPKHLVVVPDSFSALSAFRVSAVAIVDDNGGLVANLSASDLRGITERTLENLLDPVFKFLEGSHRTKNQANQSRSASRMPANGPAGGRDQDVDADDKPKGVVTLSDALTVMVPVGEAVVEA
ncbi:hypothetical protein HK102_012929 [Quaeritorhiza haematococci]|nr:hypothetical protein HK102_012929 [Quaeritorhiza haematococci]